VSKLALRELCGYRAGDKGDIANVAIFADDDETYALLVREVTADRVKAHFGALVRMEIDVPDAMAGRRRARPELAWADEILSRLPRN
jgi:hypothetical protein